MKEYTREYALSAALCNAQGELAPAQLVQEILEVATEHADALGVGFDRLAEDGNLWVLSRIAIEMNRYPRLHERYALTTWIEDYNRHFSERNFEITSADGGETLGYARTIWVAINIDTRRPADLTSIEHLRGTVSDRPCPIDKQGKIRPVAEPQIRNTYTFRVSDIDVNRHVNSARYVEIILNQLGLEEYDLCLLTRFEIEYRREAHYGDTVEVGSTPDGTGIITALTIAGTPVCLSRSVLTPRVLIAGATPGNASVL